MRLRSALLAALCGAAPLLSASAQTTHTVNVSSFQFAPATLTIEAGDTVVWESTDGFHNVRETTFGTPAGFGLPPESAPWTYSFTFLTPGEYTYDCEVHPAPTMTGSITVLPTVGTDERPVAAYALSVAPNPFERSATFRLAVGQDQHARVAVVDLAGREVALLHDGAVAAGRGLRLTWTPAPELAAGVYLVRVEAARFSASRRLVFVR